MMKLQDLAGSVWDKDGCLYRYPYNFSQLCDEAAVASLRALRPDIQEGEDVLLEIAKQSYEEKGSSISYFVEMFELDPNQMNEMFHSVLKEKDIRANPRLAKAFKGVISRGHRVHLATHSHVSFTSRSIPHMGLQEVFQLNANVHTLEEFGYANRKSRNPTMFLSACTNMGIDPQNAALVEDTAINLIPVKDLGGTTILIHWGNPPAGKKPSQVDYMFKTPLEAVLALTPPKRTL